MIQLFKDVTLPHALEITQRLNPDTHIRVYYKPDDWVFHIYSGLPDGISMPDDCSIFSYGTPGQFLTNLYRILDRHFTSYETDD